MFLNIVASSEELSVLTRVLDDYCAENNIVETEQRSALARTLIEIFAAGITTQAGLRAKLFQKVPSASDADAA